MGQKTLTADDIVRLANPPRRVEISRTADVTEIREGEELIGIAVRQFCEGEEDAWRAVREGAGGKFALAHRRYRFPWEIELAQDEVSTWSGLERWIRENHDVVALSPVYLYDHSGLLFSLAPFSCPWDSGQLGLFFVEREDYESWRAGYLDAGVAESELTPQAYLEIIFHGWKAVHEGDCEAVYVFDTDGELVHTSDPLYEWSDWAIRNKIGSRETDVQAVIREQLPELIAAWKAKKERQHEIRR